MLLVWSCTAGVAMGDADAGRQAGLSRTYQNPLLPEREIADPHVILVRGKYYLYATTHTRGYEVFVSDDLVAWQARGEVFEDPRGGAWAPDVFHNVRGDGKFYLYYTDNLAGKRSGGLNKQIGVAVAESPLGPFVDKATLATNAIDAHLFQDEDDTYYLYYADLKDGFKIVGRRMSDPLTLAGEARVLIQPTEEWEMRSGHVTEGPFMLKREGTYYLMYSGTGADSPNYGIGYATSKSPLGPFAKYERNPVISRGGKVVGPGHHSVVVGPDARLWLVYHQKWNAETNFRRFLALDSIWFDGTGVIHGRATRESVQPAPEVKR